MWYIFLLLCTMSIAGASSDDDSQDIVLEMTSKAIRHSPRCNDVQALAVEDYVAEFAVSKYFGDKPEMMQFLKPSIQKKLEQLKRNSSTKNRFNKCSMLALSTSDQSTPPHSSDDPEVDLFMEEILSQVMSELLQTESGRRAQAEHEASERVSKKNVAIISGATAIICALISAGVTVALPLTQC